jgi:hypothetical protein
MHRIDGADHVAGMFSDNGPGPATVITDDWLNDVQENLAQFIESAGITLVKGTYTQLTAAVAAYIAAHNAVTNPHSATAAATASRLVLRDAAGRTAFADPSAAQDADTLAARDAAIAAAVASVLVSATALTDGKAGITWNWTQNQTGTRLYKTASGIVHLYLGANVPAGTPPPP